MCTHHTIIAVYYSEQHVSLATSHGRSERESRTGEILQGELQCIIHVYTCSYIHVPAVEESLCIVCIMVCIYMYIGFGTTRSTSHVYAL